MLGVGLSIIPTHPPHGLGKDQKPLSWLFSPRLLAAKKRLLTTLLRRGRMAMISNELCRQARSLLNVCKK